MVVCPLDLDALRSGAESLGGSLDEVAAERFALLAARLYEANAVQNLTRVPPAEFVERHALESLHPLWALGGQVDGPVVDVGCGAGFPGLPVKIVRPGLPVTLIDSHGKALAFVRSVVEEMGLDGVTLLHARAEEAAHDAAHRERYGLALCRAVGRAPVAAELLAGFVRVGGYAVPHRTAHDEPMEISKLQALGLEQEGVRSRGTLTYPLWHKQRPTPADRPLPWHRIKRLD